MTKLTICRGLMIILSKRIGKVFRKWARSSGLESNEEYFYHNLCWECFLFKVNRIQFVLWPEGHQGEKRKNNFNPKLFYNLMWACHELIYLVELNYLVKMLRIFSATFQSWQHCPESDRSPDWQHCSQQR